MNNELADICLKKNKSITNRTFIVTSVENFLHFYRKSQLTVTENLI